ncbi:cytochrome c biogenesis protein ResB [Xylanimonas oleitrophica]|uniref:Cytochrome c biogenesis protein ResB n=1 Tax=Xylanimonas oleitrophica TaxID=2607479 RepID=A0A2W5WM86_9MICO|nr:cytochrome c biogenesis protein ResB [Xylanimonas oleitrophica]PZR51823.1 cytochrome c biogenesis protein ResB [Xylanimonas oleitrophica]
MSERTTYRPEGIDDAFVGDGGTRTEGAPAPNVPALGWRGMLRWTWRQLTSMRVALLLLMLLAVAAVPGSILPQRGQDPAGVLEYLGNHPTSGEWLDRFGFFAVYTSPWFSAIYLLLFVSLVGCIVPRAMQHARNLRGRPPRTPARFARFPALAEGTTTASPDDVVEAVAAHLRRRHTFRVDVAAEPARAARGTGERALPARPATRTVAAERGYLRETGNLVFHLALVGLLVSVALGQLLHYRGQAIVTEGRGFANAVTDYDTFENGAWFRPEALRPFSLTLDAFSSHFASDDVAFAQARDFTAYVSVIEASGDESEQTIKVNHPITVDGAKIYLMGNGFAPDLTITDADGQVAFAGRVPFLPEDTMYTSRGVIKVPDVSPGLEQIGMVGYFLPSAVVAEDGAARSVFPQPDNPLMVLELYTGDLGLDDGVPQNVYRLDTASLDPVTDADGERIKVLVRPGETVELPDGLGTVTLGQQVPRYVALDLRHDPSLAWVLTFSLVAMAGLAVSLFTPRRRVWLRTWQDPQEPGRTRVELAGLARGDDAGLQGEVDRALAAVPGLVAPHDETTGDAAADADAEGVAPADTTPAERAGEHDTQDRPTNREGH